MNGNELRARIAAREGRFVKVCCIQSVEEARRAPSTLSALPRGPACRFSSRPTAACSRRVVLQLERSHSNIATAKKRTGGVLIFRGYRSCPL